MRKAQKKEGWRSQVPKQGEIANPPEAEDKAPKTEGKGVTSEPPSVTQEPTVTPSKGAFDRGEPDRRFDGGKFSKKD